VEAVRLEETKRAAVEDLAEARITMGEHGPWTAEFEAAVVAEPLLDRRSTQLALAPYRVVVAWHIARLPGRERTSEATPIDLMCASNVRLERRASRGPLVRASVRSSGLLV
jgi:hypothetical protein